MNRIIPTKTQFNIQSGDALTWNVKPLLHEIRHALQELIENRQSNIIDLRSIPLAPGEEAKILNTLGIGEVQAKLDALGLSEIYETAYSGVWVVTHYNDENSVIGRFIEITLMPDILMSQVSDTVEALDRLSTDLDNLPELDA